MEKLVLLFSHWSEPEFLAQYSEYLLIVVFLYSFLEVIFPPIPGDTLLVISGSITVAAGANPLFVVLTAFVGTFCGSVLLYNFGLKMERKLLNSPRFSWMLDSKTFLKIEHGFKRRGFLIILLSRFLPVARSGVILAAGMVQLERRRSFVALAISIFTSTLVFVYGGRFLGRRLDAIVSFWEGHSKPILLTVLLVGAVVLGVMRWVKYLRQNKQK